MRTILFSTLLAGALIVTGCQNPDQGAQAAKPTKATQEAQPAAGSAAQTVTAVEAALKLAKRPFKRVDVKVTDEQLESIVASGYEAFETTEDPKVRVFVFHYDAAELVKPAKIARWINGSGLIHNGQTSANRLRIVVAGTPEAGTLDEETTAAMDAFMDAFMVMR